MSTLLLGARVDAVVFDLDDTLYPEREFVRSGIAAVADLGAKCLGLDHAQCRRELETLFDDARERLIDRWLALKGRPDLAADLVERYRSHQPDISLAPEVEDLLDQLSLNYRLGLVSDGLAITQQRKAEALGLSRFFKAVVLTDTLGPGFGKPSQEPFLRVAQLLSCRTDRTVYVADNPIKDFGGARASGMRTIRLRRSDGLYSELEAPSAEFEPDFEVRDWLELNTVLRPSVSRERHRPI